MYTGGMSSIKTARIAMRLSDEQASAIRHAARIEGASVTDFTVSAAVSRAHDVIAGQQVFVLDPDAFAAFQQALDAPARELPRLAALFARGSVFND